MNGKFLFLEKKKLIAISTVAVLGIGAIGFGLAKIGQTDNLAKVASTSEINALTEEPYIDIYEKNILYGDVDLDGEFTATDAAIILQATIDSNYLYSTFNTYERFIRADVDGDGVITATDAACVEQKLLDPSYIFPVQKVTEKTLSQGETLQLYYKITPSSTNEATWTSSDTSIATVDENGLVTANSNNVTGSTEIIVTIDGVSASCKINVNATIEKVSIYISDGKTGDIDFDGNITKDDSNIIMNMVIDSSYRNNRTKRKSRGGWGWSINCN